MRPVPAIVEVASIDLLAERIIVAVDDLRTIDRKLERYEAQVVTTREEQRVRRLQLGQMLLKARGAWPERGPKAKGWGEFLRRVSISEDSALRWMAEARGDFPRPSELRETPDDPVERAADHEPRAADRTAASATPPADPPPEVDIDRDTWCTPKWITDAIGVFDLDPCSNPRSSVQSTYAYQLERDEDGLQLLTSKWMDGTSVRVYCNPPYSGVMPWVKAYGHTRFCFLLKFDPSTKWFAELIERTHLILIPKGTRIQFEPPPGVPLDKAVANQFPHALFYAREADATPEIRALCFAWRVEHGDNP